MACSIGQCRTWRVVDLVMPRCPRCILLPTTLLACARAHHAHFRKYIPYLTYLISLSHLTSCLSRSHLISDRSTARINERFCVIERILEREERAGKAPLVSNPSDSVHQVRHQPYTFGEDVQLMTTQQQTVSLPVLPVENNLRKLHDGKENLSATTASDSLVQIG